MDVFHGEEDKVAEDKAEEAEEEEEEEAALLVGTVALTTTMIFVFSRHDGDISALTLRQLMRAMEKALALPSGALKSHKGLIRRLLPQIVQVQQKLEENEEKREEARQQGSKEKTAGPRNKKKQAPHAPLAGEEAVTEVLPKGHWKRKKKRRIREDREEASEEEERK